MAVEWTELKVEKMRYMAAKRCTSYQIAEAIGETRSAVCAKCWRLGIKLHGKPFGGINCAKMRKVRSAYGKFVFGKKSP